MKPDLVFHLVSKRKWKLWQKDGYYNPEWKDEDDKKIKCYFPEMVEKVANNQFADRKNILMLVIHLQRVISDISVDEDSGVVLIDDRINLDSILDKIVLTADKDGKYEIQIES